MATSEFYGPLRQYVHHNLQCPVYGETSFAGKNISYPCVLFTRDGSGGNFSNTGPVNLRQDIVTFSAKSRTLNGAETMRDTIIEMLDGYSVECVMVQDSQSDDFSADDGGVYSRDISFTVLYGANFEYFQPVSGTGTRNQIAVYSDTYKIGGSNALTVSGSDVVITGNFVVSGSATLLNGSTATSASSVPWNGVANKPVGLMSGSAQTVANLVGQNISVVNVTASGDFSITSTTSATTSTAGAFLVGNGIPTSSVAIGGGNINAGGSITGRAPAVGNGLSIFDVIGSATESLARFYCTNNTAKNDGLVFIHADDSLTPYTTLKVRNDNTSSKVIVLFGDTAEVASVTGRGDLVVSGKITSGNTGSFGSELHVIPPTGTALIKMSALGSSATLNLISNAISNYRTIRFGYGATPTNLWDIGYQGATDNTNFNIQSISGTGSIGLISTKVATNPTTGSVLIGGTGVAETSVAIGGGNIYAGGIGSFRSTTTATSTTVGAFLVGNGTAATNVAIGGGNIYAGGDMWISGPNGISVSKGSSVARIIVAGGGNELIQIFPNTTTTTNMTFGIGANSGLSPYISADTTSTILYGLSGSLGLTVGASGNVSLASTTSATTSTAGAFLVGNGTAATNVAIGGGNVNAGGSLTVGGNAVFAGEVTATGQLTTSAGRVFASSIKTTTYTATTSDHVLVGNHATVAFTITLIAASSNTGRQFIIKNKGAATVTVDGTSLGTIDGSNTIALTTNQSMTIVSDGAQWNRI